MITHVMTDVWPVVVPTSARQISEHKLQAAERWTLLTKHTTLSAQRARVRRPAARLGRAISTRRSPCSLRGHRLRVHDLLVVARRLHHDVEVLLLVEVVADALGELVRALREAAGGGRSARQEERRSAAAAGGGAHRRRGAHRVARVPGRRAGLLDRVEIFMIIMCNIIWK